MTADRRSCRLHISDLLVDKVVVLVGCKIWLCIRLRITENIIYSLPDTTRIVTGGSNLFCIDISINN